MKVGDTVVTPFGTGVILKFDFPLSDRERRPIVKIHLFNENISKSFKDMNRINNGLGFMEKECKKYTEESLL